MMFHLVRQDDSIIGWMTCDNPSDIPTAIVVKPDGSSLHFEANLFRQDLLDLKAHSTGMCGFVFNEVTLPGFNEIAAGIEIREASSGIVVYRAPKATDVNLRLFRFDMQLMPDVQIERCWHEGFRYYYPAVERHPYETLQFILKNYDTSSITLSGRLNLQRYEHYLQTSKYKFVTLIRDPVEELAERLVFLHYLMSSDKYALYSDYLTGQAGLAAAVRRMDLSSLNSIAEAFAYMSDKHIDEMTNPMTTALTCGVDQLPRREHIELALARLSRFDLVGVRPQFARFKKSLTNLVGRDIFGSATYAVIPEISALANELRELKVVRSLLSLDMRLYNLVAKALDSAAEQVPPYDSSNPSQPDELYVADVR